MTQPGNNVEISSKMAQMSRQSSPACKQQFLARKYTPMGMPTQPILQTYITFIINLLHNQSISSNLNLKLIVNMLNEQIVISSDSTGKRIQKYIKKQLLGHGGFAKCYLMINLRTGQKYAGKVIRKKQLKQKDAREKVFQQIQIHKSLNHQNICNFHDMFEYENEIYIILQLCQNNSLKQFVKNRVRITEFEAKCYLLQIINGLEYLHRNNILHRDIKLGNIFLNYKMEVKIGDFGLSTKLKSQRERRFTTCGTPNYIAPEILNQTGHSYEVDIWAVGIILYALVIGKPPFEADTVDNTYRRIRDNKFEFPKEIPLTNECKSMIKSLLQPNPKYRITIEEMRNHEFLSGTGCKIPATMPPYTISIPPQSSYLKQYMSEKHMKLSIFPRKISNTCHYKEEQSEYEKGKNNQKQKMNRVLSLDKQLFKTSRGESKEKDEKSTLNRGHIYNSRIRINSMVSSSKKIHGSYQNLMPLKQGSNSTGKKHEVDTCEIICYFDMQEKYGMAYLLSNGNYGIVFNDKTSLTKIQTNSCFIYFNKEQHKFDHLPSTLKKKADILDLCFKKLQKYKQENVSVPFESDTFAKKVVRFEDFFLIKLSNDILQFFWETDTIILRGQRWIKWRIGKFDGQSKLSNPLLPFQVKLKTQQIKRFLTSTVLKPNQNQFRKNH